jgi:antitoxin component YwqK of YwqJK toxin-antitoxin module
MALFRVRPQFSLRSLLIVVTLLAASLGGGLCWWQRIQVHEEIRVQSNWHHEAMLLGEKWSREEAENPRPVGLVQCGRISPEEWLKAHPNTEPRYREVYAYYQDLRGGRVRHGLATTFDLERHMLREEHWRNGRLHGPCTDWHPNGAKLAEGEYQLGQPHGTWVSHFSSNYSQCPRARDLCRLIRDQLPEGEFREWPRYPQLVVEEYVEGKRTGASGWDAGRQEMFFEAQFAGDVLHGRVTWRGETGTVIDDIRYEDGAKVGPARGWYENGAAAYAGEFLAGKEHGPWDWWHPNGATAQSGHFRTGRREGPWAVWHPNGNRREAGAFQNDKLDGRWTYWNSDGTVECEADYDDGLVTAARFPQSCLAIAPQGVIDLEVTRKILAELAEPTVLDFNETPLEQVVDYLRAIHGIPMAIDWRALRAATVDNDFCPLTVTYDRPLPTARRDRVTLQGALERILEPHGLAIVIRHEMILITTRADREAWRDRSGVRQLFSTAPLALVEELRKPTSLEFDGTPLQEVCAHLSDLHGIKVRADTEDVDEDMPVTAVVFGRTLAAALSFVCDQHGLTCVDRANEVLVRRAANEQSGLPRKERAAAP